MTPAIQETGLEPERHRRFNPFNWHRRNGKSVDDSSSSEEELQQDNDIEEQGYDSTVDYYLDPSRVGVYERIEDDKVNLERPFNLITLINILFVKLANLLDFGIPANSKFRNIILLQLLGVIDTIRANTFFRKRGGETSKIGDAQLIFAVIVFVCTAPFISLLLVMVIGYTTFASTVFNAGLIILTIVSSIGLFPIFIILMGIVILASLVTLIAYLSFSYTYQLIITTRFTRSIITSIADRVPPSVGSDEVGKKQNATTAATTTGTKVSQVVEETVAVVPQPNEVKIEEVENIEAAINKEEDGVEEDNNNNTFNQSIVNGSNS